MTKKELEDEIFQYFNNVISLQNSFTLYKEIKTHTSDEVDKINKYSYFFYTIIYSLQHEFILESIKLLDVREEKNLSKLIYLCRQYQQYSTDSNFFQKLLDFENYLTTLLPLIDKLKTIRDKFYAHADKKYFKNAKILFKENNIKNEELENMIKIYAYI